MRTKVIIAILSEPNFTNFTIATNIIQYIKSETIQFLSNRNQHSNNTDPSTNPAMSMYLILSLLILIAYFLISVKLVSQIT